MRDGVQFHQQGILQLGNCIAEQIPKALRELLFHLVELLEVESQDFGRMLGLHRELPCQHLFELVPIIHGDVLGLQGANYVYDAEVVSNLDFDVRLILVPRQHKCGLALNQEENAVDLVVFNIHVLLFLEDLRPEQWAHPKNKEDFLASEEFDILVSGFIDIQTHLRLELGGKLVQELLEVLDVLLALIANRFLDAHVQIQRQLEVLINLIEGFRFVLE